VFQIEDFSSVNELKFISNITYMIKGVRRGKGKEGKGGDGMECMSNFKKIFRGLYPGAPILIKGVNLV
jgi:hypothetical protein